MKLLSLIEEAKKINAKYSYERKESIFSKNISKFHKALEKCRLEKEPFFFIQDVIINLMFVNDDVLGGEYDAYALYCDYANYQKIESNKLKEYYSSHIEAINQSIEIIKSIRKDVKEEHYKAFIYALCLFIYFGDDEIDQKEYEFIASFLDKNIDVF